MSGIVPTRRCQKSMTQSVKTERANLAIPKRARVLAIHTVQFQLTATSPGEPNSAFFRFARRKQAPSKYSTHSLADWEDTAFSSSLAERHGQNTRNKPVRLYSSFRTCLFRLFFQVFFRERSYKGRMRGLSRFVRRQPHFRTGELLMRRTIAVICTLIPLFLAFAASNAGQEKHIRKADLPAAVQKTADEQAKGATVRGYSKETEDGQPEYEVQLTVNGHSKDVSIDASGNLLEVEEQVTLEKLPAEVREALQKKAGSGKITKVESLTKKGTLVAYEAHVLTAGKRSEAQVGPTGKLLDHEE